jgi:signal peptidase I
MGDNRLNSADSRVGEIGFIDEDNILGKAVYRIAPFNRIGGLYD